MASPPERAEFDVVLLGATGFTGEFTARALQEMAAPDGAWPGVRWAVAGRSQAKLQAMISKWGLTPTGVVIADVGDEWSMRAMCFRARLVLNATGPYRFYGEAVVKACIEQKRDYADLCGEPEFIDRCALKYGAAAAAAGVLIVHSCAFDSVPADIGTLFTAMQFRPPAVCAHAQMYHSFHVDPSVPGAAGGASAHATTFYAAVHGFGAVGETRSQRRALEAQLEEQNPGSSRPPPALGPKLRVPTGPSWNKQLRKYTFRFPGADTAVVRTSQRVLARRPRPPGEPYLTPQFGASFCVQSPIWAAVVAAAGAVFNTLASSRLGRAVLLRHPRLFTLGAFSEAGPTQQRLAASSFTTTFVGYGWAAADAPAGGGTPAPPPTGLDTTVLVRVSGPEPGYIATAKLFLTMARTILDDRPELTKGAPGGVFTPGGLVGGAGAPAVARLVARMGEVGIVFQAGPLTSITPRAPRGRPAWQSALNAVAWLGWAAVLLYLAWAGSRATASSGSQLLRATICLEVICAFETLQIALGMAQGNLPMGVVLHYTRLLIATVAMPLAPGALSTRLVLLAWSATEVCRYPMFLLPSSAAARTLRYVAPAATFPVGALAEASLAYMTVQSLGSAAPIWQRAALALVVPTNLLLGFGSGYPQILSKARAALRSGTKLVKAAPTEAALRRR